MKVSLLDCTLRDGGYVNDWNFGHKGIQEIIRGIADSGIEIVEIGFLRTGDFDYDRVLFPRQELIEPYISPKHPGTLYSVMVEMNNPIAIKNLCPRLNESIDIIRVMVWKENQDKALEYCKQIQEKGYLVCIQPVRTSQYSNDEFVIMVKKFNNINPYALYVVDSWGTMNDFEVLNYLELANTNLNKNISLGYHGHNNMGQALHTSISILKNGPDRNLIIDASIFGIGRGAGNLNLELIAPLVNEKYDLIKILNLYSKHIQPISKQYDWGYSMPLLLTAFQNVNPIYAEALKHLTAQEITDILTNLKGIDRIIFNKEALCKISQRT